MLNRSRSTFLRQLARPLMLLVLLPSLPACDDDEAEDADAGTTDTGGSDTNSDATSDTTENETGADVSADTLDQSGEPNLIDGVLLPDVEAATFEPGQVIDNRYFPLPVGATWTYEMDTDEGTETTIVTVTSDEYEIQGVAVTVVRDTVSLNDAIVEDTHDWYAQDSAGNVWYLGEDTCEYEGAECVRTEGSWEWGVDGALPGIIMPPNPAVDGQPYFQEYYVGHAEDVGEVVAVDQAVFIDSFGQSFQDCIGTHDTSHLDPEIDESKYYCSGVGLVLTVEGDVGETLISYEIPE